MRRKPNQEEYEEWLRTRPPDPPEWALIVENKRFFQPPDIVRSPEDALQLFGHILWRWEPGPRYLQGGVPFGERPQDRDSVVNAADSTLAEYVRQTPNFLTSLLADTLALEMLAYAQTRRDARMRREDRLRGGLPASLLSHFLKEASPKEGELLWRTIQATNVKELITLTIQVQQASFNPLYLERRIDYGLSRALIHQLGPAAIPELRPQLEGIVPPSTLDALEAVAHQDYTTFTFPELLPPD